MFLVRDLLYLCGLILGLPVLLWKTLVRRKYLAGMAERFGGVPRRAGTRPCLWVHGVSVGEVVAARTVVEGFRARHGDWDVVISSTTDTGCAAARRLFPDLAVVRYPLDFSWAVRRALARVRPTIVVLMELELWPNFIRMTRRRGIPVVVANGRISDRSFPRSRRFRFLLAGSFAQLARVAAQTEEHARRFESLGTPRERITVTGSLKYDAAARPDGAGDADGLRRKLGIDPREKVLVAGSTTAGEEEVLLDVYARLKKEFADLRLVIVPRHPERFDAVADLIRARGFGCLRRSASFTGADLRVRPGLGDSEDGATHRWPPTTEDRKEDAVVLGDTMGELERFYALASVVFVGKSLVAPGGGQNMIEPAALGKPVVFGPYVSNFQETRDLLVSKDAAREVEGPEGLFEAMKQLLADEGLQAEMGSRARAAIEAARGAADRTLDIIQDVLASRPK